MKINYKSYLGLILCVGMLFTGCQSSRIEQQMSPSPVETEKIKGQEETAAPKEKDTQEQVESQQETNGQKEAEQKSDESAASQKETSIQFIDTGNSDCILIGNSGEYMMIDGGDNDDEQMLANYLAGKGIDKLKYVVLTHPDADHCGGLDSVIESVEVGQVFIGNGSAETKTYRDFVQAAIDKGMKPSVPLADKVFSLGTGSITFFNQTAQYKDVNDNSLVTLYTNGDFKALFTGDASQAVEETLPLEKIGHVNVLKAGHHGSSTSSSARFLEAVSPDYAVICCGAGNKYGHPHKETLEKMKQFGVKVYRTDQEGTITITQEKDQITLQSEKSGEGQTETLNSQNSGSSSQAVSQASEKEQQQVSAQQKQETAQESASKEAAASSEEDSIVYITATGKKYHKEGCSSLKKSKQAISKKKAEAEGYTACSKCCS